MVRACCWDEDGGENGPRKQRPGVVVGRETGVQFRFHQNTVTPADLCRSLGPRVSSGLSSVSPPIVLAGTALPMNGKEQGQSCHSLLSA